MFRLITTALVLASFCGDLHAGPLRSRMQSRRGDPTVSSAESAPSAVPDPVAALAEVNAKRALLGLRPFKEDPLLTQGAMACARYRAERLIAGHVRGGMGDFQFLPPGAFARQGGAGAWPPHLGWGSCGDDENWEYAGAAYAVGRDGRRFMTLFTR